MPIYLARHAKAVDGGADLPDEARWLTKHGRRAALAAGHRMAKEKHVPTAIWMSPLVRAVQTAELIAVGLGWSGELRVELGVNADGSIDFVTLVRPSTNPEVDRCLLDLIRDHFSFPPGTKATVQKVIHY